MSISARLLASVQETQKREGLRELLGVMRQLRRAELGGPVPCTAALSPASPRSLFSRFSFLFLRMMKSRATPSVARITGQAMVKSFFTSSPSPWADLIGGMVPRAERGRVGDERCREPPPRQRRPRPEPPLTAVVVERGELRGLVAAAGAVAGLHAELVPGGLAQLGQEDLAGAVGAEALPDPVALGPVLQDDGGDGAAPAAPALQVQPGVRGVDVGEEVLVLAEGGLCGRGAVRRLLRRESLGGAGGSGAGSPLPCVLASMISLMRPAPTLFLAASFTLYQVPHLRLSSLKERSEELMNTSFHSSLLSTEYWSTKPAGARTGRSPPGRPGRSPPPAQFHAEVQNVTDRCEAGRGEAELSSSLGKLRGSGRRQRVPPPLPP